MSLSDDHSSAKFAIPPSVDKNDLFSASVSRFGMTSGTPTSTILYHGNSEHVHAHRRLANTTALGLGLTGLFLAIGLIVAWYGYFRSIVNPDARSGFGRDPLRRNRGSHLSSNQQGEDFEYEREEDIDDGASPPGGGMRRASDSSGDEGWATQPPPPPAGLTDPEDRYRGSAMTGGSDDIYDDTLGPKGSQRWDWVDRSNEEEDYDEDGEDRNDDDDGGRKPSTYTYKRQQQQNHTKANNNDNTFSLPASRSHKGSSSWRALSEKVVQKENSGRNGDHKILGPIQADSGDTISRPHILSSGLNESIDGLLKKYEIGTSIKDGIRQGLGFLRRQASSTTRSSSNSKFPTITGGVKDVAPQLPESRNVKGGGYARSTATTSASSRSGPPMGQAEVEFSFDEESLGLESHSTTFIYSGGAGDDMESVDWEAQATERMEWARKKLSASGDIRRARSKEKSQAPIVIGKV